jgi:hypothetical protein
MGNLTEYVADLVGTSAGTARHFALPSVPAQKKIVRKPGRTGCDLWHGFLSRETRPAVSTCSRHGNPRQPVNLMPALMQ